MMEPINWLAVVLAANLAVAVGIVWHGPLFRTGRRCWKARRRTDRAWAQAMSLSVIVLLIGAAMLGHSFARIGADNAGSQAMALFDAIGRGGAGIYHPGAWLTHARDAVMAPRRVIDCGFWLVAYLAMGGVFWALG